VFYLTDYIAKCNEEPAVRKEANKKKKEDPYGAEMDLYGDEDGDFDPFNEDYFAGEDGDPYGVGLDALADMYGQDDENLDPTVSVQNLQMYEEQHLMSSVFKIVKSTDIQNKVEACLRQMG